ncbi:MAG: HlyD family secretion protein [Halodesulfovibrio sp.]|uniref:HlyD family secretion protein n=1 Tax=Halodesulfovibrio sp. TaxID=1912772 RepID=UPI00359E2C53
MRRLFQWFLTCAFVATAIVVLLVRYEDFLIKPWTRDGQVQADIITIASRVTGPIVFVGFRDNQYVKKGELLFTVDKSTFIATVNQAKAQLKVDEANAAEALDVLMRSRKLVQEDVDAIARQALVQYEYAWQAADAKVNESKALLETAQLDLNFTDVYAPVSGYITNYSLYKGTMSVADVPLVSIVDASTYWIYAYFRETEIRNIRKGDKAEVTLMGYPETPILGVVQSLGWGIYQSNSSLGQNLLPEVNATFEWIRLAQRIPIRIYLTHIPPNVRLRVGTTASILIDTDARGEVYREDGEVRQSVRQKKTGY